MDMDGLKYFIKAAETLNFTRAASECSITQTAMSQHISSMENTLGFKLFNRTTRSVSLTPAGSDFYIQAKRILDDYTRAVQHCTDIASGKISTIRILVPSVVEGHVVMPRFQAFQRENPGVKLEIGIRDTHTIAHHLNNGLCDIAISWPYEFNRKTTLTYSIAEFDLDLLCSCDHPLAGKNKVALKDIAVDDLYSVNVTQMPRTRFNMERMWADQGLTMPDLSVQHNVSSVEEILLRIGLNPRIMVLVPMYLKHYLSSAYTGIPLDAPFKFPLAVAMQKDSPRPEILRLAKTLSDPRIPLDY